MPTIAVVRVTYIISSFVLRVRSRLKQHSATLRTVVPIGEGLEETVFAVNVSAVETNGVGELAITDLAPVVGARWQVVVSETIEEVVIGWELLCHGCGGWRGCEKIVVKLSSCMIKVTPVM